jgi:periplasmic copper chaperone A
MAALPLRRFLVLLALPLLLAACGGSGAIEASDVWARESPATAQTGAIYLELHNNTRTADALVGIQTPACGRVELHESAMDENGVMRMAPVPGERIELPAGSHAVLAPGGLHIMCLEIADPFVLGETISLTLQFAVHEPLEVAAEVRSDPP